MNELRAAVGLSRERLEDAYEFLGKNPPLGLAVQRHGDELRLVTAPEVSASVQRHLDHPRPVALSNAALEVLAIVAYRQPIARSGIAHIRGSASDSAIATLLERGLIAHNPHQLFGFSCNGVGVAKRQWLRARSRDGRPGGLAAQTPSASWFQVQARTSRCGTHSSTR